METEKPTKAVCPTCKGNGYVMVPYKLSMEEVVVQCTICNSKGEINADKVDDIIIDSDGMHRLQ